MCAASVAVASLVLGFARAAENPPAPATANGSGSNVATPGDSISSAKRDFDAIKAARDPAQQQKAALPKFGVPELQTGSSDVRPWSPATKGAKDAAAKAKSANWLVDAMQNDARDRADREREGLGRSGTPRDRASKTAGENDSESREQGEAGSPLSTEPRTSERVASFEQREARDEKSAAAPNPLTRYLGDWMTPRDYAVLKPTLDEAALGRASGESSLSSTNGLNTPGGFFLGEGVSIRGSGAQNTPPPGLSGKRENPYLTAMESAPGPSAPVFSSPPSGVPHIPLTLPPPRAVAPPMPTPTEVPKSKIPDFAKPAHDEKHFKQLKRF